MESRDIKRQERAQFLPRSGHQLVLEDGPELPGDNADGADQGEDVMDGLSPQARRIA
jgi:hypothetical protein